VSIKEPVLGAPDETTGETGLVAYRVAVPNRYAGANDVTMRMFFHRTGPFEGDCFIFSLDAVRLIAGEGVAAYGDRRWIRIDGGVKDAALRSTAELLLGNGEPGLAVVIDLPINSAAGLGYPALAARQFLAFELATYRHDGGFYHLLGVEFFESRTGTAATDGATIFTSDDDVNCGPIADCNDNEVPDDVDIAEGTSEDCNENLVPDECDIAGGASGDCDESGVPDECEIIQPEEGGGGPGGSVFLTGHDPDFHATLGGNTTGARNINTAAVDFVMDPVRNTFVAAGVNKFMFVESSIAPPGGHTVGNAGIIASGYVDGTDYDRHDAGTLGGALDDLGTTYSAIVIASDFGGLLTQAELDILNARAADIISFLNAGGGLYAMAESNGGSGLTPNGGHFGYLPFVVVSAPLGQTEIGNTVTPFGAGLGLADADVNGNASHNIFTETSGLTIVDIDSAGNILSLAARGEINPGGGFVTDCNVNDVLDRCELAEGLAEDCNENGILDECDIASGASDDCNQNEIPDECETDCNENGIPDDCEIGGGAVSGDVLYGSQGGDTCNPLIFTIDSTTGVATQFADLSGFKIDTCGLTGLTLSADGGTLFVSNRYDPVVFMVDTQTADVDVLFLSGPPDRGNGDVVLSDLAFSPDGRLIGSAPQLRGLVEIDLNTGDTTFLCDTEDIGMSGLALSPGGIMYGSTGRGQQGPAGTLFSIDLNVNDGICDVNQIGNGTGFEGVSGLAFAPDGRLFGSTGFGGGVSGPELIEIDTTTGLGTLVAIITGADVENIDGLALAFGGTNDCNEDGIPDECQLDGNDCNNNNIPDDCEPECQGETVTISDDTFANASWLVFSAVATGGSTQTANQDTRAEFGNPSPYRVMTHSLPVSAEGELVALSVPHVFLGQQYTPSGGAIDSLDFSLDRIVFFATGPAQGSVGHAFVVVQNGTVFTADVGNFTSLDWETVSRTGLTAADFVGPGGVGNPDFSTAGSVLSFGYRRLHVHTNTEQGIGSAHGVDNWSVTIHTGGGQCCETNDVAQ